MKNLMLLVIAFFVTQTAFAQMQAKGVSEMPTIEETEKTMSKGTNAAFFIMIDGTSKGDLEKEWKDFTKDFKAKAKQDRKSKEWLADDAKISSLSDNAVDVYADIRYESKDVSSIYVWFDLGGAFVNSETHAEAATEAEKILQKFVVQVYKHQAEDVLKSEEKALSSLEKDLKKLEKDNQDYHKKIEEAKELIAKMEKNIETNVEDQKKKGVEIDTQKEVVKTAGEHVKDFGKLQ